MKLKAGTKLNDAWPIQSLPDDSVIRTDDGRIFTCFTLDGKKLWAKTFSQDVYGGENSWLPATVLWVGTDEEPEEPLPEDSPLKGLK